MSEERWIVWNNKPIPSTSAMAWMFCTASLFSICTITRISRLADSRYSDVVTPHTPCVNGLPKPRLPTGGNRLSATTSLAFSAVDTCWPKLVNRCRISFLWQVFFFSYQRHQDSACTTIESMLDLPTRACSDPRCRDPDDRTWTSIWHRSLNSWNTFSGSWDQRY